MSQLFDLVGFTTTTTGTGTITVAAALSGHRTLAGAGIADGTVVSYGINSNSGAARETGTGTVGGSGTTLTRTLSASSTGALLNLSGTSEVYITPIASDMTPGGSTGALQMRDASANFGASNVSQDTSGRITVAAGTQTTAGSALSVTGTWNSGATTFGGLTVNMTDTASAAGSLILDLQRNASSRVSLSKTDVLTLASGVTQVIQAAGGNTTLAGGQNSLTSTASFPKFVMPNLSVTNAANSGSAWFYTEPGLLYLSTSAFATGAYLMAESSTVMAITNGTAGQYRDGKVRNLIATQVVQTLPLTVATLPAAASWSGGEAYVTDANAPTVGGTVASGGSGRARVGSNGTNWIVTSVI